MFAGIQYIPFMEKLLKEKDKYPELSNVYDLGFPNLSGMYELRSSKSVQKTQEGKLKIDFGINDPNFIKINQERIEIGEFVNEGIDQEAFIKKLESIFKIHQSLYNNLVLKFGLIKTYEIHTESDLFKEFFKINEQFKSEIENCKTFFLLKKEGFNINVELIYFENKLALKVDINDIIQKSQYHKWDHFNEIILIHDKIINEEIYNYFGNDKNVRK